MSAISLSITRREIVAATLAAGAISMLPRISHAASGDNSIRPFTVNVPQRDLDDLRRRISQTRWPDKETVQDISQGPQLANVRDLVNYWGDAYDWRRAEAQLNALPQFKTLIDGVDVHFIHVRSRHPHALPVVIVTWLARIDFRADQTYRSAYRSDGVWWPG